MVLVCFGPLDLIMYVLFVSFSVDLCRNLHKYHLSTIKTHICVGLCNRIQLLSVASFYQFSLNPHLFLISVQGFMKAGFFPSSHWEMQEYTLVGSPVHHKTPHLKQI